MAVLVPAVYADIVACCPAPWPATIKIGDPTYVEILLALVASARSTTVFAVAEKTLPE